MNFLDYALHHIGCAARLARGEARALDDMDITVDGFWQSFYAIPAAIPALFFSWVVEARQLHSLGVTEPLAGIMVKMAFLEGLFWILPVVGLAIAMKPLGYARRYSHLIIARNWLSALLSYLFVIVPLCELAFPAGARNGALDWLSLLAIAVSIWLTVRITRIAINAQTAVAVGFVAAESLILLPLAITFYGWAGLYPPA